MTPEEIRAAICADQNLIDLARAVPAQTQQIADLLSVGRVQVQQPCLVGEGTVSDALDLPAGPVFIFQLKTASEQPLPANPTQMQIVSKAMLEQAWRLLSTHNLDMGLPSVRGAVDQFVGSLLTAPQAAVIKSLAEVPYKVDELSVRRAIFADNGDYLV